MGRLILIEGENNSGKSRFAEKLAASLGEKRCYIATMRPVTEENHARIEKHRIQRADLGFKTLEIPCDVESAEAESDSVVLLEDISNLLANNIFEKGGGCDSVFEQVMSLAKKCAVLIAVTVSRFDYDGFDSATLEYMRELSRLNQRLFESCQAAVTMENAVERVTKGDIYGVF